jgi:hypothetical protein
MQLRLPDVREVELERHFDLLIGQASGPVGLLECIDPGHCVCPDGGDGNGRTLEMPAAIQRSFIPDNPPWRHARASRSPSGLGRDDGMMPGKSSFTENR